jgi:hypothetical protein
MPGVPNGLGAVLFCEGGKPQLLEVYTHGSELWDGVHDGFELANSRQSPQRAWDGRCQDDFPPNG